MAERYYAHAVKLENVTEYVEYLKDTLLIVQSDMVFTPYSIGKNSWVMISYLNDLPVLADAGGVVSYEYGSTAPTYVTNNTSTFVDITDGDSSTGYTLVADNSLEDMDTVGTFDVTFTVTDSAGNVGVPLAITFTIVDTTIPVITDTVGATTYEYGTTEPDWTIGVTALDGYDGDITSSIVVTDTAVDMDTIGTFDILYDVDDANSNSAVQVSRTITIEDTTLPVITDSIGASTYEYGTAEPTWATGVTALDDYGSVDLTGSIVITDTAVDMNTIGTFDILYNVVDAQGNNAVQVVRTITIEDTTIPVITASGENVNTEDASAWTSSATAADDYLTTDITGDLIITYFKDDDITPLTLSQAKTDLYAGLNVKVHYNVSDSSGNAAVEVIITLTAVDNTIPVITAVSELINVSETAAWVDTATALDNKDGVITGSIVPTYFQEDNTTSIASLALFRTYVNNSSAGETGYVHYNVDDAATNSATEVTISVTAEI